MAQPAPFGGPERRIQEATRKFRACKFSQGGSTFPGKVRFFPQWEEGRIASPPKQIVRLTTPPGSLSPTPCK